MSVDDLVDVGACEHPILRKDGVYEGLGLVSYTCMQPDGYVHKDS